MPRASGKTTMLIKESAETGKPIIVANSTRVNDLEQQSKEMGLRIPEPVSAYRWITNNYCGGRSRIFKKAKDSGGFLIDDLDCVLGIIFRERISKATYTPEKWDIKGGFDNMNDKTFNNYWDMINLLGTNISSTTMNVLNETFDVGTIRNINVIVPDKVVEIEFYDGKEKMVCHKDDTFDLRKCCFIAIAKHLYKKEYTQEGIEYMATQLTYQKKYAKIVDKALKDYKKREEEKEKKTREEEKERIIRDRQSLRRWRQKQRRILRRNEERNQELKSEREEMISMMAEAINRAKDERKKNKD